MQLRAVFIALLALFFAAPAFAAEQINRFDVLIDVQTDGDIVVTETINVTAEGSQIQRGIFRDLPRYYETDGERLHYNYHVESVTRDGRNEPYDTETDGNAYRIRIGDEDVFLNRGDYTYEIRYRVENQVRYFADYDEVYWNATGNYWAFPIREARAIVHLPNGAVVTQTAGYTGASGKGGQSLTYRVEGNRHIFQTTQPLWAGDGLTVAIGFAKGVIDPPSSADATGIWWQRYGALAILLASLGGVVWFLYGAFNRVGRDPPKGPVFPRYEAPRNLSPAGAHVVYYRGTQGHRALIATLMNLAVKGHLTIDASEKKNTVLMRTPQAAQGGVEHEDAALEESIFGGRTTKAFGGQTDAAFTSAYESFSSKIQSKYGEPYFKWNIGYMLLGLALTAIVVLIAASQVVNWSIWHTLGIIALAAINVLFMYLMPAPTKMGQEVRTEIEGFRLYMETAEKLALNAAQPGSEQPPTMTKERYERFLPYAVALGVEAPWTKYFEHVLPEEASSYNPGWTTMGSSHSLGALSSSLVSNISSGVSSAMPQSSSSSGSGGGGSSGGGGGGGGGGGW